MDHSPFENLLKTLVPLIIFIIWAMISRPAKKKKQEEALKRRRQQEIETRETELGTQPSHDRREEEETAKDDWKRSLEDALEEMGLPVERKPAPQPLDHPQPTKTTPPPGSLEGESLEDLEPEVVPEKPIDEKMKSHLAIQEAAYTLGASPIDNQKVYTTPTGSASANTSETPLETVMRQYTTGELQKFIVWSELLGKPVGLREKGPRLL